jgi:glycosyltransferase involved in cell wall biosynthesis
MKLLVFAHVPPPYHGQSYEVERLLNGYGGDRRKRKWRGAAGPANSYGVECYHVNARYSRTLEDVGEFQGTKIFLILFYCLQAVWCRFRYGVETFYYVPAPGKSFALYRDWLVMLICRPFYKRVVFHWLAGGLSKWLETTASMRTRSFTYRRMRDADLSIILSDFNRRDAEKLTTRRVVVVEGGIPDPCPQFETEILPRRRARAAVRKNILSGGAVPAHGDENTINVIYLAHCTREKGAFDAIEGVALANEALSAEKSPLRFRITLIGAFAAVSEEMELRELANRSDLGNAVEILGFVPAERKDAALRAADIFCFPTYYLAESQPSNLIEALAFGLAVVTTRWRSVPEMLPPGYPGIVDPKSPGQIAGALRRLAVMDLAGPLRESFLRRFTLERHLASMAAAFRSVEDSSSS